MQISPRYDSEPMVVLDVDPNAVVVPLVRQRRRLVNQLRDLTGDQWAAPSRCEGWSAKDVVSHLVSTNGFWSMSLAGALVGEPTRFLDGFDPKATPAALAGADASTPAQVLDQLGESTESLCSAVEGLSRDQLDVVGEAPPGHVPLSAVLHHALWDCWIHERDILLPLGVPAAVEGDEVAACLRYVPSLAPVMTLMRDPHRHGALGIRATNPDTTLTIEVADVVRVRHAEPPEDVTVLEGDAVQLVEALSIRAPLEAEVPEHDRWLVAGLAEVFEQV